MHNKLVNRPAKYLQRTLSDLVLTAMDDEGGTVEEAFCCDGVFFLKQQSHNADVSFQLEFV